MSRTVTLSDAQSVPDIVATITRPQSHLLRAVRDGDVHSLLERDDSPVSLRPAHGVVVDVTALIAGISKAGLVERDGRRWLPTPAGEDVLKLIGRRR